MGNELNEVIRDLSQTLATGTPPGKPADPSPTTFITGVITAIATSSCTVAFPSSPGGLATTITGLPYVATGRTLVVGDVVLVMQTVHQRLVVGAIGTATPTWTAPTFQNSWTHYGGGYNTVGWIRDGNFIILRGMASGGTINASICNLPVGARPAAYVQAPTVSSAGFCYITVLTNGDVVLNGGANAWVSLDGIRFSLS